MRRGPSPSRSGAREACTALLYMCHVLAALLDIDLLVDPFAPFRTLSDVLQGLLS